MTLATIAILLFAAAAVLVVAEMLLPAHGVIGAVGALALIGGVGVVFWINQWLGLGMAFALTVTTPFAVALWMKLWPKTPIGRRLFLAPPGATPPPPTTAMPRPGQTGVTVSELRPTGVCEFAGERVEARAEHGMVPPGHGVRVVGAAGGHVIVRPV